VSNPVIEQPWWLDGLDKDGSSDERGEATITDKQAADLTEMWKQFLRTQLADDQNNDPLVRARRCGACHLAEIATDAYLGKQKAGGKRAFAHGAQRVAVAGSAAVAAGTGGALAAGLSGTPAHVFGIVILALGIATAALTALSPDTDYQRFRGKARAYEELWRNVWAYATTKLLTASAAEIDTAIERFAASSRAVGSP
jgi:hypothetical protein